MSSLDQVIDYTKTFQDVELATAVGQLKQNPAQLQQFLQGQQGKIFEDVIKQKDSTFQKVYGDLNRASQAQESILMLDKRNQELAQIQTQIYQNQKSSATATTEDKNLAGRKYEMNQWSVANKNESVFIYSMLFIVLMALVLVTALWNVGMISSSLAAALSAPIVIGFVLVVINRTTYTNIFRDKRYWNRNNFNQKYGKIPVPLCPTDVSGIQSEFASLESEVQSDLTSAAQNVQSGAQTLAQGVSSAAQGVSSAVQGVSTPAPAN